MKHLKFFRILGIAIILSLLIAAMPTTPALAASVTLSASQSKIGSQITVSGTGFTRTTINQTTGEENTRYVNIYLSNIPPPNKTTYYIDTDITSYATLFDGAEVSQGDGVTLNTGTFSRVVTIPAVFTNPNNLNLVEGTTYYIYVTGSYSQTMLPTLPALVAPAMFTIIPGATLDPLSPASGPAGTAVTISGANFPASQPLIFKYDGATITPKAGTDTQTRSSGIFISTITIPQSTADAHTITVTVGTSTATATFTVTASANLDPLSPASGPAGTAVTISGANFPASQPLIFKYDVTTVLTPKSGTDAQTRSSGLFISVITIPSSTSGAHTITVTAGSATATATFTVTGPAPTPTPTPTPTPKPTPTPTPPVTTSGTTLSLSQTSGSIGTPVILAGAGFKPKSIITVKYDDATITTTSSDDNGLFLSPIIQIPPSQQGDHTITVSDGTNTNKVTFTVESTPPPQPKPLRPEMGAKVKSPISFGWEDVTDNSSPVTYKLQIATSKDFAASAIVMEKTGLAKSEYTLTEEEELKLAPKDTPYYWRIKAVDAAQNESAWTGAGEFYASPPFKFTGWPLYAAFGVGLIIFFLLGFLVGKRTAFYY